MQFIRVRRCFLRVFGKLRLSDQVQFIAWQGIQRQILWILCRESEVSRFDLKTIHSLSAEFVRWSEGRTDLKHLRVFILNNSFSKFPYFY